VGALWTKTWVSCGTYRITKNAAMLEHTNAGTKANESQPS